jgi:hypothetical protein
MSVPLLGGLSSSAELPQRIPTVSLYCFFNVVMGSNPGREHFSLLHNVQTSSEAAVV